MRISLFILLSAFSFLSFGQSITDPAIAFPLDTPFVFRHFDNEIVVREHITANGELTKDTICSRKLNLAGKVIAERYLDDDSHHGNEILIYNYDEKGRNTEITIYLDEDYYTRPDLPQVNKLVFFYNDFDSIVRTDYYSCKQVIKSKTNVGSSGYGGSMKWKYKGYSTRIYDSSKNRIKFIGINNPEGEIDSIIWNYNSSNKKTRELHYYPDGSANSFYTYKNNKIYKHTDTIAGIREFMIQERTYQYPGDGSKKELIYTKWYEKVSEKVSECQLTAQELITLTHYYDPKGRLLKKTEEASTAPKGSRTTYRYLL